MATGQLQSESNLIREQWVKDGLLKKQHMSFFNPFIGTDEKSIIRQVAAGTSGQGITVNFDYTGFLTRKAVAGRQVLRGNEESMRRFSSQLTLKEFAHAVELGHKFDLMTSGMDDPAPQATSSLLDWHIRQRDQNFFDAIQGLNGQTPSHILELGTDFGLDQLHTMETAIKTSSGLTKASNAPQTRAPLMPYIENGMSGKWIVLLDNFSMSKLVTNGTFRNVMQSADVRGDNNRLLSSKGITFKDFIFVEAGVFFGSSTPKTAGVFREYESDVVAPGLRIKDNSTNTWSGQSGFPDNLSGRSVTLRGAILGCGALQYGRGSMPIIEDDDSDYKRFRGRSIKIYERVQKLNLKSELDDYEDGQLDNVDYGVIPFEFTTTL